MNILLIGGYGLLGRAIYSHLQNVNVRLVRPTSQDLNLMVPSMIDRYLSDVTPDLIIHAAGYTNVEKAETDFESAFNVNCHSMYNLISSLRKAACKPKVMYFSTDYVFGGEQRIPYTEYDIPSPINHYGKTKAVSEDILRANYPQHFILRSSWLFGVDGRCFPLTVLNKLKNLHQLTVANDQVGTPTYTRDIAARVMDIIKIPYGTYHITNQGSTTWFDFARLIVAKSGLTGRTIVPSSSDQLKYKAMRPQYSVLDNSKLEQYLPSMRSYEDALIDFLNSLEAGRDNT